MEKPTMMEPASVADQTIPEAAAILKALADPNRLRIFAHLMTGDSCNCELNEKLGLAPNLLSHHLRILKQAGLINSRPDAVDARWIYYAVARATVDHWHHWFAYFLDPARIREQPMLCGPEGQQATVTPRSGCLED
jgi:ArsR family transcriptional regulator